MQNRFLIFSLLFLFVSLIVLIHSQVSFAVAPTVVTGTSSASSTQATLNGEVTGDPVNLGGYDRAGFVLGTASVANADGGSYDIGTSTVITTASTTAGSWSLATTSLSMGQVYFFRAYAATTTYGVTSTEGGIGYGDEVQFITGVDEPTNLARTAVSQSDISLSWATTTGAHEVLVEVRYSSSAYPTSISGGTQGCQVNGTACTVSGLLCSTTYYFRVWATTTDTVGGMSTSSDTYSQLTDSIPTCTGVPTPGSGRSLTAPTTYSDSLVIAGGATSTKTREVTLALKASNVSYMSICNDNLFLGSLENYATTKTWTLTEGDGLKTVYVKFVSPDGMNSDVVSDAITLKTVVAAAPVPTPTPTPTTPAEEVPAPALAPATPAPVAEEKPISEMTVDEIKAKVAEITAQIKVLQEQLVEVKAAEKITGCTIASFDRNLKQGMSGNDVKCLQIILNSSADTKIAASGVGSAGNETTYFGALTKAAVIKFQKKYASEILAPWDLTDGNGLVFTTTRAKLNELLGK